MYLDLEIQSCDYMIRIMNHCKFYLIKSERRMLQYVKGSFNCSALPMKMWFRTFLLLYGGLVLLFALDVIH